jgi:hypothetical protein
MRGYLVGDPHEVAPQVLLKTTSLMQIDMIALCETVRVELEGRRAEFNRLDVENGNHGDHLLVVWGFVEQVARQNPNARPEIILAEISRALGRISNCNTARAYTLVCNRLARRFSDGNLSLDAIADLAGRLVKGLPPGSADGERAQSAGRLAEILLRQLGGQKSLGKLAGQYDAAELLTNGLAVAHAARAGEPLLEAGITFLVGSSPLGYAPQRKASAQLILKTLLIEIDRQTSCPS